MSRRARHLLAVAAGAVLIAFCRPRLSAALHDVRVTTDVYALPPPSALPALSLGYRSALADLLFTSTVIAYGIHGEEHRRFEHVGDYLEAIITLDPSFREPYRLADTLIVYQATGSPSEDDVRLARRIVEQGLETHPRDAALWSSAGQFMAFIATQFLSNEQEKADFKAAGARALARAGELTPENQNIQWQSLAAAGIFTREGEREAAIAFLEKVFAVTDDEQLREAAAARLRGLEQESMVELARRRAEAFNAAWRSDLPFASRTRVLVLGPHWDAALCAGSQTETGSSRCAQTWTAWSQAVVAAR